MTGQQKDDPLTPGVDEEIKVPSNYLDVEVQSQMNASDDSDGDKKVDLGMKIPALGVVDIKAGDNYGGYIRFRSTDKDNPFAGDGAMDIVVDHWRNDSEDNTSTIITDYRS